MIEIIANIANLLIFVVINGLLLNYISGSLKFRERSIFKAFLTSIIAGVVNFGISMLILAFPVLNQGFAIFFVINAIIFILLIKKMFKVFLLSAVVTWIFIAISNLVIGFFIGILLTVVTPATAIYLIPFTGLVAFSVFGIWFAAQTVRRREAERYEYKEL